MEKNAGSETKKMNGAGGGGFRAKLEHILYSGEKKHVIGGIAVIGVLFGVPWYFMTREYIRAVSTLLHLEKADKARSERLSAGSSSTK